MKTLVPLYNAVMLEIERRRHAAGISMDEMSELMGTAERAYSKMIHAETPSGRVGGWDTVQKAVDVLFTDGFKLRIQRSHDEPLTSEGTRRKIRNSAVLYDRKGLSERMAEIGRKGGEARKENMMPSALSKVGRMGARARWRTPKIVEVTCQCHAADTSPAAGRRARGSSRRPRIAGTGEP